MPTERSPSFAADTPSQDVAVAARQRAVRWARWGVLATTVALGAAVILTGWLNLLSVRQASTTLYNGQTDVFAGAIAAETRGQDADLTPEILHRLLGRQARAGLRSLAVYDRTGALRMQAGMPATPVPRQLADLPVVPGQRWVLQRSGTRMRALLIPPPLRDAGTGPVRLTLGYEDQPRGPTFRPIIIEFEPLAAERLAAHATRTLALGVVLAVLLVAAAAMFLRMSQRQDEVQRRLEHQRRLGALGEMSAVLAHEIRNPLASLKGHAQLLAERLDPGSSEGQKAGRVVREAARLEALAANLLVFARSGGIQRSPTDPAALLREAAEEVDADAIDCDARQAPASWSLDADGVRRTLANVLRNAVQASPPGARVEATVQREHDCLVYVVRDCGPGFPAARIVRLFDPFVTTRASGTGLGLAVAQRIVQMHGGTITADNAPGGGARVRISIPANGG